MQNGQDSKPPIPQTKRSAVRTLLAVVVCLMAAVYTAGVVFGIIPQEQRIDTTNLMILALAVLIAILLVKPDLFDRLKHFKLAGFELEIDKIKRSQELQQGQLEAISLLLPLVLRDTETKHLRNLGRGKTTGYVGSEAVRTELRRLANLKLIERIEGKKLHDIKDDLKFDLSDHVRLTPFGQRMAMRLEDIEKDEPDKKV